MRPTAFIFHGTGGYPDENWFPWLKEKLEEKGYEVFVPQFPTPEGQSFDAWMTILAGYKPINENSIVVAHSLGCIFLLRLLEHLPHKIRAAFFVSGIVGVQPIKNYVGDTAFSGGFDFDWATIKTKADHFAVFHSDNDPYVALANGQKLADNLGIELTFVPNAGHFNATAGYTQFPELWSKLANLIREE